MRILWCVTAKELRSYFNSAIAFLFLGAFLAVAFFTFFWVEKFFVRNIADVRPLFQWLPLLLIFLVSALTMRLWSEEQKLGTLEVLLTHPVRIDTLVLGKFLAGLLLVALALAMTLGIPITVSMMGDLDWGPVVGGYLAALLVASAYLAVGLCISSTTDNQIVALIFTVLSCLALYLPGTDAVSGLWGNVGAEFLRSLGTGSRFESIARGVVNLRDLTYYLSIVAVFLVVNMALLAAKRWSAGHRTQENRFYTKLAVLLCVLNAVALNMVFSSVASARIDLTEKGEYSISPVTERLLGSIDEPLLIRGYFSERTHPLLTPLVPRIKDLLTEYGVVGGSRVTVEFFDPRKNEEIEKEAQEEYGIKAVPFRIADRHEQAVVNSYFHILVKYGDQHETLSFDDLIEVTVSGDSDIEVSLRNLEYDVTRSIKKVVSGFQSVESLFASFSDKAELTLYVTPDSLPGDLQEVPARIETVAKEFQEKSGGKFVLRTEVPTTPEAQEKLFRRYGLQPIAVSIFSNDYFYLHLILRVGDRVERVVLKEAMTEADIRDALDAALRRGAPGFLKNLGMVTPKPPPAPPRNQFGGMPPVPQGLKYTLLEDQLSENYSVRSVSLDGEGVPSDIDALLVVGPENLSDAEQRAFDQYLMRGGSAIVLAGRYKLNLGRELAVTQVETGLEELFKSYGFEVADKLVLDQRNSAFPIPILRDLGGFQVRDIRLVPYPFFLHVRKDQMVDHISLQGLPALTLQFASPITLFSSTDDEKQDDETTDGFVSLLSSSEDSWLQSDTDVQPDFARYPEHGFSGPPDPGEDSAESEDKNDVAKPPFTLAVAKAGVFDSHYKKGDSKKTDSKKGEKHGDEESAKRPEHLIQRSPPGTRLVVIGSSSFVADEVLQLSQQAGGDEFLNNLQFIENVVDWAVADVELLSIRTRGSHARTLAVDKDSRKYWEWVNYGLGALFLFGVVFVNGARRRNTVAMTLLSRAQFIHDSGEKVNR